MEKLDNISEQVNEIEAQYGTRLKDMVGLLGNVFSDSNLIKALRWLSSQNYC